MSVVENSWNEEGIEGWGWFVFKEKLKRLKETLKTWNEQQFGSIYQSIKSLHEEIKEMDIIDEAFGLTVDEASKRSEALALLLRQLHNRKSLLGQKAKLNWLRDGDVNNKLFHHAINSRRRWNGIAGLEVEGS